MSPAWVLPYPSPSATTSDERKRLVGGDEDEDDDEDDEEPGEGEVLDWGRCAAGSDGGGDDGDDSGSCFTTISEASRVRMSSHLHGNQPPEKDKARGGKSNR
uniref:Uncharacterized protein n=1 Tax=Anopheles atroparvus TaxID=41427 RepID=A0A182IJR1_ANOAO